MKNLLWDVVYNPTVEFTLLSSFLFNEKKLPTVKRMLKFYNQQVFFLFH